MTTSWETTIKNGGRDCSFRLTGTGNLPPQSSTTTGRALQYQSLADSVFGLISFNFEQNVTIAKHLSLLENKFQELRIIYLYSPNPGKIIPRKRKNGQHNLIYLLLPSPFSLCQISLIAPHIHPSFHIVSTSRNPPSPPHPTTRYKSDPAKPPP